MAGAVYVLCAVCVAETNVIHSYTLNIYPTNNSKHFIKRDSLIYHKNSHRPAVFLPVCVCVCCEREAVHTLLQLPCYREPMMEEEGGKRGEGGREGIITKSTVPSIGKLLKLKSASTLISCWFGHSQHNLTLYLHLHLLALEPHTNTPSTLPWSLSKCGTVDNN